jgi:hypothetical protein
MFCVYGMMNQQFPEPGAEAFDLGHVGFSSFSHGFAHFGFAFSVLGTTKSEAETNPRKFLWPSEKPIFCGKIQ